MLIITNPDEEFTRNKKKAIKKNNGFCINAPRTEGWKCHRGMGCQEFQEMECSGWCKEALYYKDLERD